MRAETRLAKVAEKCQFCYKDFTNQPNEWRAHMKLHFCGNPKRPKIRCLLCGHAFISQRFVKHFKPCAKYYKDFNYLVCDDCCHAFKDKKRLMVHYYRQHAPLPFKCSICKMSYATDAGLATHKLLRHRPPGYITHKPGLCKICNKQVAKLRTHMYNHMEVVCDDCDGVFANKQTLAGHVGLHFPSKKRHFECGVCGKRFSSPTVRWRHELCHSKPFICDVCGLSFTQKGSMEIHKRLHLPALQRPFACGYCNERFTTKWYKVQHEKKCETNEK